MKDAKGRELKAGDVVMVPCRVEGLREGDFPGLRVREVVMQVIANHTHTNDGSSGITMIQLDNVQVLRANPGDDTSFRIVRDDDRTFIR